MRALSSELWKIISFSGDTELCQLRVKPWIVRTYICVTHAIMILAAVSSIWTSVNFRSDGWESPVFYFAVLESQMNTGVVLHAACYYLVTGLHVVLPLLRMTALKFEEAAKIMDISKLEVSSR